MFGVNYKFAINENKSTIKLRPTLGSLVTITVATVAAVVLAGPVVDFAVRQMDN